MSSAHGSGGVVTGSPAACITGFNALVRHVRSLERSIDFYVRALGFAVQTHESAATQTAQRAAACQGEVILALGNERIALHQMPSDCGPVRRVSGPDVRFQHVAIVTADMQAAYHRLQALSPEPITRGGPQTLPAASGGATAFKFRDPDGHPLELIAFADPPDRWRARAAEALTLGMDHSAISVSDVGQSIAFYCGLGFQVGARQVNRGPEQARLDGLDESRDVEVEVVSLIPGGAAGFHLELLGYRQPAAVCGAVADALSAAVDRADCLVWTGAPAAYHGNDPDGHRLRLEA